MAFKPNYSFERRERDKAKAAKKEARLQAKREKSEKNKEEKSVADVEQAAEPVPVEKD
jgi:hypothetical protein